MRDPKPSVWIGDCNLLGCVEKLAADQYSTDLRSSGADLVQFGIAQQTAGREIIDVAVTSERLNRFECHPCCPLGRVKDCARRAEKCIAPAASLRVVLPRSHAFATAYT